ncbi:MAG TPA: PspC domain-containing protein [Nocardioidaceae bacterium]|nr:PspC domain-containing protein [Nocardioidaceae bacterium]
MSDIPSEARPTRPPAGDRLRDLDSVRRPTEGRVLGGVAAGLARHFDIDPIVVRVLLVVAVFFGGGGLLCYLLAWLTVPSDDRTDSAVSGWLRTDPGRTAAGGLAIGFGIVALCLVGSIGFWAPHPGPMLFVAVLALAVFAIFARRHDGGSGPRTAVPPPQPTGGQDFAQATNAETQPTNAPGLAAPASGPQPAPGTTDEVAAPQATVAGVAAVPTMAQPPNVASATTWAAPPPARPRRRRSPLFAITLLVIAVALSVTRIVQLTVVHDLPGSIYAGLALAITAVALLVGAWWGRSRLLILLGLVASLFTLLGMAVGSGPFGQHVYAPTSASAVRDSYRQSVGQLVVQLAGVHDVRRLDGKSIDISETFGQIQVIVPTSVAASIDAHVAHGRISGPAAVAHRANGGQQVQLRPSGPSGRPQVTLHINLTGGQILIQRADCPGIPDRAGASTVTWHGDYLTEGNVDDPPACN